MTLLHSEATVLLGVSKETLGSFKNAAFHVELKSLGTFLTRIVKYRNAIRDSGSPSWSSPRARRGGCQSHFGACGVGEWQPSSRSVTAGAGRSRAPSTARPRLCGSWAGRDGALDSRDLWPRAIRVLECYRGKVQSRSSDGFANGHAFNGGFKISSFR